MNRVYLNQKQLEALIAEGVQRYLTENEIDEGKWWQAIKGAASKIGGDASAQGQKAVAGAKDMRNRAGNAMRNTYHNVANRASNAVQGVKNYANSVKQAGQRAGTQYENQQIINQLEDWWQQGKFKGRTTRSAVTQLINALNRNFTEQYGE